MLLRKNKNPFPFVADKINRNPRVELLQGHPNHCQPCWAWPWPQLSISSIEKNLKRWGFARYNQTWTTWVSDRDLDLPGSRLDRCTSSVTISTATEAHVGCFSEMEKSDKISSSSRKPRRLLWPPFFRHRHNVLQWVPPRIVLCKGSLCDFMEKYFFTCTGNTTWLGALFWFLNVFFAAQVHVDDDPFGFIFPHVEMCPWAKKDESSAANVEQVRQDEAPAHTRLRAALPRSLISPRKRCSHEVKWCCGHASRSRNSL